MLLPLQPKIPKPAGKSPTPPPPPPPPPPPTPMPPPPPPPPPPPALKKKSKPPPVATASRPPRQPPPVQQAKKQKLPDFVPGSLLVVPPTQDPRLSGLAALSSDGLSGPIAVGDQGYMQASINDGMTVEAKIKQLEAKGKCRGGAGCSSRQRGGGGAGCSSINDGAMVEDNICTGGGGGKRDATRVWKRKAWRIKHLEQFFFSFWGT